MVFWVECKISARRSTYTVYDHKNAQEAIFFWHRDNFLEDGERNDLREWNEMTRGWGC